MAGGPDAAGQVDDFFRQLSGKFLVMGLLHCKSPPASRNRIEIERVPKDFGHWRLCLDYLVFSLRVHSQHFAAAAIQIAHDITHGVFRNRNFHLHDRFKQNGIGFLNSLFKTHTGRYLEGHFR